MDEIEKLREALLHGNVFDVIPFMLLRKKNMQSLYSEEIMKAVHPVSLRALTPEERSMLTENLFFKIPRYILMLWEVALDKDAAIKQEKADFQNTLLQLFETAEVKEESAEVRQGLLYICGNLAERALISSDMRTLENIMRIWNSMLADWPQTKDVPPEVLCSRMKFAWMDGSLYSINQRDEEAAVHYAEAGSDAVDAISSCVSYWRTEEGGRISAWCCDRVNYALICLKESLLAFLRAGNSKLAIESAEKMPELIEKCLPELSQNTNAGENSGELLEIAATACLTQKDRTLAFKLFDLGIRIYHDLFQKNQETLELIKSIHLKIQKEKILFQDGQFSEQHLVLISEELNKLLTDPAMDDYLSEDRRKCAATCEVEIRMLYGESAMKKQQWETSEKYYEDACSEAKQVSAFFSAEARSRGIEPTGEIGQQILKNDQLRIICQREIGQNLIQLKRYDKAEKVLEATCEDAKRMDWSSLPEVEYSRFLYPVYSMLAMLQSGGSLKEAAFYTETAVSMSRKILETTGSGEDIFACGRELGNAAILYDSKRKYDKARSYATEALDFLNRADAMTGDDSLEEMKKELKRIASGKHHGLFW